eukprot:3159995-Rhodomonas_salina.3
MEQVQLKGATEVTTTLFQNHKRCPWTRASVARKSPSLPRKPTVRVRLEACLTSMRAGARPERARTQPVAHHPQDPGPHVAVLGRVGRTGGLCLQPRGHGGGRGVCTAGSLHAIHSHRASAR